MNCLLETVASVWMLSLKQVYSAVTQKTLH